LYPGAVRLTLTSLVVAAALALAGCGDDTPKIKSKADFVAAADRICVDRDASTTRLKTDLNTDDDLAKLSGGLARIYDQAITKLEAVPLPPGSGRAGAQKYVHAISALRDPVKRMEAASTGLEAAIKTRRTAALKDAGERLQTSVNTVQVLGDVADAAAREYGMHNCGQNTTPSPIS
jgi:hypothetical protein